MEITVSSKIEEQDLEAFYLLKSILKRPAMYVGTVRFDYMDFLFHGYWI